MLVALGRFLPKSAAKALPFFKLLKKGQEFYWSNECEDAFQLIKQLLSKPPILSRPHTGETLYVYLSINDEVIASVLVREDELG